MSLIIIVTPWRIASQVGRGNSCGGTQTISALSRHTDRTRARSGRSVRVHIFSACGRQIARPKPSGCAPFVDPAKASPFAPIFWRIETYPATLRVRVEENTVTEEDEPIRLDRLNCIRRILVTADGHQHVVLMDRRRAVQLLCEGRLVLRPNTNLVIQFESMRYINLKRGTLRVFLSLYRDSRPGRTLRHDAPSALNLRDTLMVFDGKQHGLSDREIAIVLYGKTRVAEEWPSRSGPLRARVRRLIANGEKLVNGDYRRLLRR